MSSKDQLFHQYAGDFAGKLQLVAHDGRRLTESLVSYDKFDVTLTSGLYKKTEFVGAFPLDLSSFVVVVDAHSSVPIAEKVKDRVGIEKIKALWSEPPVGARVRVMLANGWEVIGLIKWVYAFVMQLTVAHKTRVWVFKHAIIDCVVIDAADTSEQGVRYDAKWQAFKVRRDAQRQEFWDKKKKRKTNEVVAAAEKPPQTNDATSPAPIAPEPLTPAEPIETWDKRQEGPFIVWQRQRDGVQMRHHPAWDHWKLFLGPGKVETHPGAEPPFEWADKLGC